MPSIDQLAERFGSAMARSIQKARSMGQETSRRDQLLAAVLLPFFLVASMGVAVVFKQIILDLIPEGVPSLGAIGFVVGVVGLILTFVAAFAWVKTGGFGLFE